MSIDVQKGKTKTVRLVPSSPMSTPAASVLDRSDEVKASGLTCAASAVNTTVASDSGNTRQTFQVASGSGIVGGLHVRVTDATWGAAVGVVSSIDGTTCRLVDPLPDVPSAGSAVRGLDVEVTIPTTVTDELYRGYTLSLTDDTVDSVQLSINVVRHVYAGPCQARDVRALLARGYAGEFSKDEVKHQLIADAVNARIRGELLASATYLSDYWDPDALALARSPVLRLVLAEDYQLREAGSSRDDYLAGLKRDVDQAIGKVLRSAHVHDADGDGVASEDETKKAWLMELVL